MKYAKYFLAILAASVFVSCSKEFLETTPTSALSTSNVFVNEDYVEMAVNGVVYQMQDQAQAFDQGCCGENYIMSIFNEYPSQEFNYPYFQPGWATFMNGTSFSNPAGFYTTYGWAYYYRVLGNANNIICNTVQNSNRMKFYVAQGLTFRAWCFTKLLELYAIRWKDSNNGAADGIVLRIDTSTGDIPVSSMAACYKQIYDDLDQALKLYKESNLDRPAGYVWLPNADVAHAIYAKAALNREDYATALEQAKLAQANCPLMSVADYKAGFCDPTSEWIFGRSSANEDTDNMWYWMFGVQFSCNGYYSWGANYGAGNIDYAFIKRMPNNDIRKGLFITEDKFSPTYDWTNNAVVDQTYGEIKDMGLLLEVYNYLDANTPACAAGAYSAYLGGVHMGSHLKFWVKGLPGYGSIPYIRTSEMVLIEAEANYFLNKASDAQAALVKLNASTGRQPGYTCSKTGDALFQEIVDYRELELWGEGFNWHDYKRWKKDIVRIGFKDGGNCHTSCAVTVSATANTWTWAIPENETLYNGAFAKSNDPEPEAE